MAIEFTGRDLVTWFREHPSNGQEWQYRIRYQCQNGDVVKYVNHTDYQSVDADGMRVYRNVLPFEDNLSAGLTRSPKVYLATQEAGGKWSDEREIESFNPAPPVPPMIPMYGYDMAVFSFTKPVDTDWTGFCLWADTQYPVRKEAITSKYIGPNNVVTLPLVPDTKYYITYAAYDAFGTDLLNEATYEFTTLSLESKLLPVLNERLEAISALNVERSTTFTKLGNAYSKSNERTIQRAVEKLYTDIDNGTLVSGKMLELETKLDDFQSVFGLYQETQAGIDFAQSEEIQLMGAKWLDDIEAAMVIERLVRVTEKEAYTLRLDQQASRIGENESQFNDRLETIVNEQEAQAIRITDQSAVWNSDISGAITAAQQTINETIANETFALSQRIDTLSAQMGDEDGWVAALQEEARVRAEEDGAIGERITGITVGYDGQLVTIQENISAEGNRIDGLSAQYTVRIDNQGRVGGFGLLSDANQNFEFAINADRFLVAAPGVLEPVFEVVAGQVRMKTAIIDRAVIKGAQIDDLSVNTIKIAGGAITANQVMTSGDTLVSAGGSADFLVSPFMTIGDGNFGSGIINVDFTVDATVAYDASCKIQLWVDTGAGYEMAAEQTLGITTDSGNTYSRTGGTIGHVVSGAQVRVIGRVISGTFLPRSVARTQYIRDIRMTLMGAKR